MNQASSVDRRARAAALLSETLRANLSLVEDPGGGVSSTADDELLFAEACRQHCVSSGRQIARITLLGTLLWWPTDMLVYGRAQEHLQAVTMERITMLVTPVVVLLLLRSPRLGRRADLIIAAAFAVCCAVLSYGAGLMGQLDEPWFHVLQITQFGTVLMPLPPARRALHSLVIPISLWLGLLVPFPENLSSRYLALSLSLQVATYLMSVAFGHGLFVLNRQSFIQSRVIHRDAEMLKDYSAHLEQRVEERTVELRRLLAQVESAREQERTRMSRELHDELGQELAVIGYEAGVLQRRYAEEPRGLETQVEDLAMQLEHARLTLRALVTDLRPRVLDDLGLCAAVEWLVTRTEERGELPCQLSLTGEAIAVPDEVAIAAFRVVQESLTNALRHAQARSLQVSIEITPERVSLRVRDDGKGVSPERLAAATGVGLLGMRERATHLGGQLTIESAPGAGTEIRCQLPIPAPAA